MLDFLRDLWDYMKQRKKYWLAPLIVTLLVLGALLAFAEVSSLAPLIYTIF
jgi:Family of unknown function (DUF5989)